jgi:hypothetical protein
MEAAVGAAHGGCCKSSGWKLLWEQRMDAAVGGSSQRVLQREQSKSAAVEQQQKGAAEGAVEGC